MKNKTWKDITVGQFNKITEVMQNQDEYTILNLIEIVFEVDASQLPAKDIEKYLKALEFLNKTPKPDTPKKYYVLNGTKYDSNLGLPTMTTGQFIDYQNYSKNNKIEEILSCFFTPHGHSYSDGYSIEQVKKDLLELPITEALDAAFFFKRQFKLLCNRFQYYLLKSMKKAKMNKETINQFRQLDLYSLESFPIYLNTAKQLMKHSQQP